MKTRRLLVAFILGLGLTLLLGLVMSTSLAAPLWRPGNPAPDPVGNIHPTTPDSLPNQFLASGGLDVFGHTFEDFCEVDIPSFPEPVDNPSVVSIPAVWPQARVKAALHSSPVMFIENVGQFDAGARFQVRGGMGTMWLTEDAIWVTVFEQRSKGAEGLGRESPLHLRTSAPQPSRGVNLKLSFPGANPHPRIEPFDRMDTVVSYFIGNDPAKWQPNVPVWGGVRYVDLYPGIDLEIVGENGRLVQRLVAQPGADLSRVRLRVEGSDTLALDGDRLRLTTAVGEFTLPLLTVEGLHVGHVNVERINVRAFDVTPPFSSTPLLPSPSAQTADASDLLYATFLGGSGEDYGLAIAVDGAGSAYVAGSTYYSSDFPTTPGAFDTSYNGGWDVFVVKLNAGGTGLAYATFLGGSADDYGYAIAVDGAGRAYVTGRTWSSDLPTTPGAFDTSHNGSIDAFMVKLNAGGMGLAYATFLGGGGEDGGYAIAVDGAGSAHMTGYTYSSDFPTTPWACDTSHNGNQDAFVVKVNAGGRGWPTPPSWAAVALSMTLPSPWTGRAAPT